MASIIDQIDIKFEQLKSLSSSQRSKGELLSEIKSYIATQCDTIKKLSDNLIKQESKIAV